MTKMIMAHLIVDFDGIVVDGTTKVIPKANGKSGNHTYSESVTSKQAKAGIGISSSWTASEGRCEWVSFKLFSRLRSSSRLYGVLGDKNPSAIYKTFDENLIQLSM